jgi:hypothetical protein
MYRKTEQTDFFEPTQGLEEYCFGGNDEISRHRHGPDKGPRTSSVYRYSCPKDHRLGPDFQCPCWCTGTRKYPEYYPPSAEDKVVVNASLLYDRLAAFTLMLGQVRLQDLHDYIADGLIGYQLTSHSTQSLSSLSHCADPQYQYGAGCR